MREVLFIWQKYEFLACPREAADIVVRRKMTSFLKTRVAKIEIQEGCCTQSIL